MMHKAWSSIEEVPLCFSRLFVKLQDHMGKKIANFDPNGTFPDCNSSWNLPIAFRWCTKLEEVSQGDLSNLKVTWIKKVIWLRFGRFRIVTRIRIHGSDSGKMTWPVKSPIFALLLWEWIFWSQLCTKRGITIKIWTKIDDFRDFSTFQYHWQPSWTPSWICQIV